LSPRTSEENEVDPKGCIQGKIWEFVEPVRGGGPNIAITTLA